MVNIKTLLLFGFEIPKRTNILEHTISEILNFYQSNIISDTNYPDLTKTFSIISFENTDIKLCKYFYKKEYLYLCLLQPQIIKNSGSTQLDFKLINESMNHPQINDLLTIYKHITNICVKKNEQKIYVLNKMY